MDTLSIVDIKSDTIDISNQKLNMETDGYHYKVFY